MPKSTVSIELTPFAGNAKRRIWFAMATVFTVALVASVAWGLYGIAHP